LTEPTPSPNETPRPQGRGVVVDPVLVLILNLFAAGCLGYFRIGQKQKGIVAAIVFVALMFPTMCMGSFAFSLLTAIDGYLQAKELAAGGAIGQWTFFKSKLKIGN
jgi:hypothetical protein